MLVTDDCYPPARRWRRAVAFGLLAFAIALPAPVHAIRKGSVTFRTSRDPAKVYIEGNYVGDTPLSLDFPCAQVSDRRYRIERKGCEPVEGIVNARVAPGRIIGAAFSFGISLIFICPRYFQDVTVRFQCADDEVSTDKPVRVEDLPPPHDLRRDTPAARTSDADLTAQLRALASLRDRGVISEEQYRAERERILRDLER